MAEDIGKFIDSHLGERRHNTVYGYSDLFLARAYTAFCGGDCAEDIVYLKDTMADLKGVKAPSPDTILSMESALCAPTRVLSSKSGVKNQVNVNGKMNAALLGLATHLGVLDKSCQDYCLDFDHQFIPAEKHDSAYSYKKERGYFPGVASIGNVPVHIEGRNGNSSVKFNQLDTLKRVFAQLEKKGIRPARARMDCGSYLTEVCDWLQGKVKFYIRAEQSDDLLFKASMSEDWRKIELGYDNYETCSIEHRFGKHVHRVVCYRQPNKNGQVRTITGDANKYLFIITNDLESNEAEAIKFYNKRGNAERLFDIQNNDFNWKKMPYSFLDQNTVYLIMMAMCNVLYQWLIKVFSESCAFLSPKHRLKKFTFRFVCIAAKITRSGRRQVVNLFTDRDILPVPP